MPGTKKYWYTKYDQKWMLVALDKLLEVTTEWIWTGVDFETDSPEEFYHLCKPIVHPIVYKCGATLWNSLGIPSKIKLFMQVVSSYTNILEPCLFANLEPFVDPINAKHMLETQYSIPSTHTNLVMGFLSEVELELDTCFISSVETYLTKLDAKILEVKNKIRRIPIPVNLINLDPHLEYLNRILLEKHILEPYKKICLDENRNIIDAQSDIWIYENEIIPTVFQIDFSDIRCGLCDNKPQTEKYESKSHWNNQIKISLSTKSESDPYICQICIKTVMKYTGLTCQLTIPRNLSIPHEDKSIVHRLATTSLGLPIENLFKFRHYRWILFFGGWCFDSDSELAIVPNDIMTLFIDSYLRIQFK